jgi:hypothetical protein
MGPWRVLCGALLVLVLGGCVSRGVRVPFGEPGPQGSGTWQVFSDDGRTARCVNVGQAIFGFPNEWVYKCEADLQRQGYQPKRGWTLDRGVYVWEGPGDPPPPALDPPPPAPPQPD